MPMIGARFYTQLDAAQLRSDVIEVELSKVIYTFCTTLHQMLLFWHGLVLFCFAVFESA